MRDKHFSPLLQVKFDAMFKVHRTEVKQLDADTLKHNAISDLTVSHFPDEYRI